MNIFEMFIKDLIKQGIPRDVAEREVYELSYGEIEFTKNIIAQLISRSIPFDLARKRAAKRWNRHQQLTWCDYHDSKQDWYKKQKEKWEQMR